MEINFFDRSLKTRLLNSYAANHVCRDLRLIPQLLVYHRIHIKSTCCETHHSQGPVQSSFEKQNLNCSNHLFLQVGLEKFLLVREKLLWVLLHLLVIQAFHLRKPLIAL